MASAEDLKKAGNAALQGGDSSKAIDLFTQAIGLDPSNHVLYSNRCAAYQSEGQFSSALNDSEKVISLKPDWFKGYVRKGSSLAFLGRTSDALQAYQQGLQIDPTNDSLKLGFQNSLQQLQSDLQKKQPPPPTTTTTTTATKTRSSRRRTSDDDGNDKQTKGSPKRRRV